MAEEVEAEVSAPRRGFFALLWGMIRHPHKTLEYLRDHGGRGWLVVALVSIVLIVLTFVVSAPITARMAQEAVQTQLEQQQELAPQSISPEVQQQVSQFATNPLWTVVFPSFGGVFMLVVGWLVWAGALHLLSVIVGGNSHFGRMWRAVIWGWIPIVLRYVMQIVFILVTGQVISNQGLSGLVADSRPVSEIITAPPSAGRLALRSFLAQIDLFNIWNLALLVVGVAVMARLSTRKAILVTLGIWAILIAFQLLLTALPSLFLSGGAF